VATANALLHPLRIPRQVIVNQQRAELQVYAFGGGFGGNAETAGTPADGVKLAAGSIAVGRFDLHQRLPESASKRFQVAFAIPKGLYLLL